MSTIIDLAAVQSLRDGLTGEAATVLEERLMAADAAIKSALRYDPVSAAVTGFTCSGNGTRRLFLPRIPITAVGSLTVGGTAWAIAPTASYKVFIPPAEPGRHWLEAIAPNVFTGHQNNIVITYTAGYAVGSPELAEIGEGVAQLAILLFDERKRLGLGSKTLGADVQQQILRNPKDFPAIAGMIEKYRRQF